MRDLQTVPTATFDHFDLFFLTDSVFNSGFFFFPLFQSPVLGFYLFIYLFYISFGEFGYLKKKKKIVPADRYGPTNSVRNIE